MIAALSSVVIILIALLGAAVPSLIWLFFFLRKDLHPEPKQVILYTFTAGALASLITVVFQYAFKYLLIGESGNLILMVVILAFVEELFKFLAAFRSVSRDPAFDEAVDAMIYMIAAALGFASVENLFIFAGSVSEISAAGLSEIWNTFILRFFGATLLHSVLSAIVGFYWARGRLRNKRFLYITFGIILVTILHGAFNYLILKFDGIQALIYPGILLVSALSLVFVDFERLRGKFFKKSDPQS